MDIGVEISLYPLRNDYIPPIRGFIERLNADGRFRVTRVQVDGPKVGAAEWAKAANVATGARFT